MAEPHLGDQTLEAGPIGRRHAGSTEVVIDYDHLVPAPPQPAGPVDEGILQPGRLAVLLDLARCRLPDINDGLSITMSVGLIGSVFNVWWMPAGFIVSIPPAVAWYFTEEKP